MLGMTIAARAWIEPRGAARRHYATPPLGVIATQQTRRDNNRDGIRGLLRSIEQAGVNVMEEIGWEAGTIFAAS